MGGVSDVRERAATARRADGAAFDLAVSKLQRPLVRADTIHRSLLTDRLARDDARPIVSVVAPAGPGDPAGQPFGVCRYRSCPGAAQKSSGP